MKLLHDYWLLTKTGHRNTENYAEAHYSFGMRLTDCIFKIKIRQADKFCFHHSRICDYNCTPNVFPWFYSQQCIIWRGIIRRYPTLRLNHWSVFFQIKSSTSVELKTHIQHHHNYMQQRQVKMNAFWIIVVQLAGTIWCCKYAVICNLRHG